MTLRKFFRSAILVLFLCIVLQAAAFAGSCETVVHELNARLSPRIDEQELVDILRTLNRANNRKLPDKFVTKEQARAAGWRPGKDLWTVPALMGSSMGGDKFKNREGRLPDRKWREADLDYKGGHRGGKRIVFSRDGERFVTVDHYRNFVEVPACR